MTATLKHRIIELLSKDLDKLHSISDIAKILGVAYSHAHSFVSRLAKEKVILIQKIGNVSVCSLNLKNPLTLSYLSLIETRKTLEWTRKNPHSTKLYEKIEKIKDNIHCILIKNNHIMIIVPEKITGADFSMFRNRSVMNISHLRRNRHHYKDRIILHGAEKFWSFMAG